MGSALIKHRIFRSTWNHLLGSYRIAWLKCLWRGPDLLPGFDRRTKQPQNFNTTLTWIQVICNSFVHRKSASCSYTYHNRWIHHFIVANVWLVDVFAVRLKKCLVVVNWYCYEIYEQEKRCMCLLVPVGYNDSPVLRKSECGPNVADNQCRFWTSHLTSFPVRIIPFQPNVE